MKCFLGMTMICFLLLGNVLTYSDQLRGDIDPAYGAAYKRWCMAIDSNPQYGEPFWLSADHGPSDLSNAVRALLSIGPNLTPFLVEELRKEKDNFRIYRLVLLLNGVSGINLYFGSGEPNFYAGSPRMRDRFIAAWDAGNYSNASELLSRQWHSSSEKVVQETIDPDSLNQIRRYGVFAIPFIMEQLDRHNSPELFAAFLIITGQSDAYTDYIEHPRRSFSARAQKLSLVKDWARSNEQTLVKLQGLHARIKALTAR